VGAAARDRRRFGDQRIYASGTAIMFSRESCYFFVRPAEKLPASVRVPQPRRARAAGARRRAQVSVEAREHHPTSGTETSWSRRSRTGCGKPTICLTS